MHKILVKLADKFDSEGKHDLADAIDSILTTASRPKAPLKGLDDKVKKNLILFLVDADDNIKSSTKGLDELFKRMRYFDIGHLIKDLGLDKVVKDVQKTQSCLDDVTKNFYAMTFGKHPSRDDLKKLLEELDKDRGDEDDGQAALDFFSQHADDDYIMQSPSDEEDIPEDEYSQFMNSLYSDHEEDKDASFEDEPEDMEGIENVD